VEQLVGNSVFKKASALHIGAKKARWAEHTDQTPFLRLTLLTVKGVVGSRIRGGEQIAMRADILMNKRIPVSKEFVRTSSVSSFSFVGTCSIMETIADKLGQDVVQWLPGAIAAIPENMPNAPWATRTAGIDHNAAAKNAARRHNWQIPVATNFATIDNVDALPANDEGKANYRQYLTMPAPKAFVIYSDGSTRAYSSDPDAMSKSLDTCVNEGKGCWLYAVDDTVVWSANEALRIGMSARLRKRP
jgi:hypothetical protein